ncbi:MAG: polysaccharide deacetylase family protein [Halopseudomonas aestusnigri]
MSNKFCGGHVLLYHGIFKDIPSGLESRIHNVRPEVFKRQISWLKQNFDIVTIDDFSKANDRKGLAAVTFDDAYASVFSEALPWLIDEAIPATIFLNSSLVDGDIFWRDKVRYLITNQLIDDFLYYCNKIPWVSEVRRERFYKDTKKPSLNSLVVSDAIDDYFRDREFTEAVAIQLGNVIARRDDLISHPLITYGNHSHSHYVLSSLTEKQQHEEITRCQSWLEESELELSRIFAAPFGGSLDVNETTNKILVELGVNGLLMSRNSINPSLKCYENGEINVLERYMAPSNLPELQEIATALEQRLKI